MTGKKKKNKQVSYDTKEKTLSVHLGLNKHLLNAMFLVRYPLHLFIYKAD